MPFPAEPVPDTTIIGPHHLYIGFTVAYLAVMVVWDDGSEQEPIGAAIGLFAALFGFMLTWPQWPTAGALVALGGLAVALADVARGPFWHGRRPWFNGYRPTSRAVVLAGVLIALDDVVQHAFGVPTPLDLAWNLALAPALPGAPIPV